MPRFRNRRGVSLVEALIAIALTGMAAAMYLAAFHAPLKTRQNADNAKVALNAAQLKMEEIRDMARSVGGYYKLTNSTFAVAGLRNGIGTVRVEPYPTAGETEMAKVTVTITWTGSGNTGGTVTLVTLISSFG